MSIRKQLPDGWQWVTFGDVAKQLKEDADPESGELERYVAGEHMNTDDLRIRSWGTIGDGYLGPAFHRRFRAGQILYGSRRTYLRKVTVADFDGICANTTFVIEAKPDVIYPDLLPFIMQSEGFTERSIRNSKGSVNPYINWKDIASYEFYLPPLDEQRRIAEILWAAEETIEEYLSAVAALSLSKKIVAHDHIERLPIGNRTFSQIGDWFSGGTPSRECNTYWHGEIPWASPKDMKVDILMDTEEHVSEEGVRSGSRMIPPKSILFVTRGLILAHTFPVAMTGKPMAFNQDIKAVVAHEGFDPTFVFYWLQYNAPKFLRLVTETSHGTKRLSTDSLASTLFPDISIEQQEKIAGQLGELDKEIDYFQEHIKTLRILKRKILSELLNEETGNVQ
ncbi:MAG: restriction endonuclease subunit S [Chloroflexi bacterium]|nr:restriction endonuclease subunit S [Chloroflexota bacterium]